MYHINRKAPVRVAYEYPPIPDCGFDYRAWHEGDEESHHCGWGETEAEARADLARMDEEWAEYMEEWAEYMGEMDERDRDARRCR